MIDGIKKTFLLTNQELFNASRKREYFGSVIMILPSTWNTYRTEETLQGQSYTDADADIRVDVANPLYGNIPFTIRGPSCGEQGEFIHITPGISDKCCI